MTGAIHRLERTADHVRCWYLLRGGILDGAVIGPYTAEQCKPGVWWLVEQPDGVTLPATAHARILTAICEGAPRW
jgi:hypothetical protein